MKNMKYLSLMMAVFCSLSLGFTSCSDDDEDEAGRDMTYPEISSEGIVASPVDCEVYRRGQVIAFNYVFTDNQELGAYNLEIHDNFDHHTDGTSTSDCPKEEEREPVKPWHFIYDGTIPAGQRSYTARVDISIPTDIDTGDYHFMIRLTDRTGWQQLKAMSIKIAE